MTDVSQIQMLDINRPEDVEIVFSADRNKMWVNVDGICRLRVVGLAVVDGFDNLMKEIGVRGVDMEKDADDREADRVAYQRDHTRDYRKHDR